MKKIFRFLLRCFTGREWRCHKRRIFFKALFSGAGIEDLNYRDMAGKMDYYPFYSSYWMHIDGRMIQIKRVSGLFMTIWSRKASYEVSIKENGEKMEKKLTLGFDKIHRCDWI